MKKALGFTLVLALVLVFSAVAFAAPAEEAIGIKGGTVTVNVIDDFSTHSASDNYANGAYWSYEFDGSKMQIKVAGATNALYHIKANEGPKVPNDDAAKALWASAKYVGYQIKNGSSADVILAPESTLCDGNEWGALMQNHNTEEEIAAWPIVLLSKKNGKVNAEEGAAGNNRSWGAVIPAGFDGWVFFPIARLNGVSGDAYFNNVCFYMDHAQEEFVFTVDNLALAENLDVTPGGSDDPTTTADVSTIAFAVVSVLGCGALAVRKKR